MPNRITAHIVFLFLSLFTLTLATNTTFHIISSASTKVPDGTPLVLATSSDGDTVYFSNTTKPARFTLDTTTGTLSDHRGLVAIGFDKRRQFFAFNTEAYIIGQGGKLCDCSIEDTTSDLLCDCSINRHFGTVFLDSVDGKVAGDGEGRSGFYYLVIAPQPRRGFHQVYPKASIVRGN